jgi:hypothetical protein
LTLEEEQAARKAWREGLEAEAEKAYAPIIAEHASELLTSPEKVLAKLAAKLYTDTTESLFKAIMQGLPQVVETVNTQTDSNRRAEQYVVTRVPELTVRDNPQETQRRMNAFRSSAYAIRQMEPNLTADELIARAGAATKMALGLLPGTPAVAPTPPVANPANPAPFRPGRPGGGALPTPAASDNVFASLTDEWDKEDGRTK